MADRDNRAAPADDGRSAETILIVEDDAGVARLIERHLGRAGYASHVAADAAAGLAAIRSGGFDLIVLDQNLDGATSGLDLFEQIRAGGDPTPAILVTGLSDEATLLRAMRGGLSDFVPKTIDFLDDLGAAVDRVARQLRTRRELAESESRLAGYTMLAEAIPQIVWAARPDGYVDYFNSRWAAQTGLSAESSLGTGWRAAIHPDDLGPLGDRWARAIEDGGAFEAEYRLLCAGDGGYRWFLVRAERVVDGDGRPLKWFGTSTDIDDKKRAVHDLERANELAEAAGRAKDQFLAMLSHELRTPLTPLLLAASAARDDATIPAHLRPTFELFRQNLELEARLIDDLLDVMRIVQGKMVYHREIFDARDLVARAVATCRAEAKAKRLDLLVAPGAEPCPIDADPARFQQVIWNLVRNSIKFTPEGGSVAVRAFAEAGRFVAEVRDTGIGIEPGHLGSIFDPFAQGEDAVTRKFGGLGLGLAIGRSIVEGHGGRIEASSAGRGRGATFRASIPLARPAPAEERVPPPHFGRAREPRADPVEVRILLVEDDVMTSRVMAKLLRGSGYGVTTANTVASALAVAPDAYDLVVSDIGLPDGTGLDLIRAIRDRGPVPAIALTGFGREDDVARSLDAGFAAHLIKPLDFTKLDAMIRRVAGGRGDDPDQ